MLTVLCSVVQMIAASKNIAAHDLAERKAARSK